MSDTPIGAALDQLKQADLFLLEYEKRPTGPTRDDLEKSRLAAAAKACVERAERFIEAALNPSRIPDSDGA